MVTAFVLSGGGSLGAFSGRSTALADPRRLRSLLRDHLGYDRLEDAHSH